MNKGIIAVALCTTLAWGCGDSDEDDPVDDAGTAPSGLDVVGGAAGEAGDGSGGGTGGDTADDGGAGPAVTVPVDDGAPADGTVSGRVVEALDEVPLAGVEVALLGADDDRVVDTASTDALGEFDFAELPRSEAYRLELSIDGYLDERVESVRLPDDGDAALEPVRLVSDDNAGEGGLTGTILDAVTGEPVAGLSLRFRRGIEARTGTVVADALTGADGGWTVANLGYGNLTCEIAGDGFQTLYTTVTVLGGLVRDDQNASVSPEVAEGDTRIVLSWGETPSDLDAHLTGPGADGGGAFHVYYAAPSAPGVELDVDDVSSFGPETITADLSGDGPFRYSVRNFSNDSPAELSGSEATVRVERGDGIVAEFFVPRGEGDLWTVFDVIGGEIVPVDEISTLSVEADFFSPDLIAGSPRRLAKMPGKE